MTKYKGIDLSKNKRLCNYIQTYYAHKNELDEAYMESDASLQKIVKSHYIKKHIIAVVFNVGIYIAVIFALILTRG